MTFRERGGWWVVAQLLLVVLYGGALLLTEPVREGVGLGYARVVGAVLTAVAVVVGVWSALVLGSSLSPYPAPSPGAALADRGPYRVVRHPIYGAVIVGAVGLSLAFLRPWALLVALAFPVFFMAKTGHEEELLVAALPGYREYRARVPRRLLPWLL